MKMTAVKFFEDLKKSNTMFSATTVRKRDKKVDGVVVEPAGAIIKSVYRLNVPATIKEAAERLPPGLRKHEDEANNVLTVYDMTKRDKDGKRGAFRRLNLGAILEVKAKGKRYIPVFDRGDNEWKLTEVISD